MTPTSTERSRNLLVVVPCGFAKIWDRELESGPQPAKDAYIGTPFKMNRRFAEKYGDRWVILSAKYGFIDPDFTIEGPYNTTFKKKSSRPIAIESLAAQVVELSLDTFSTAVGLGGIEYRRAVQQAFNNTETKLVFPFAGLPIGKCLRATKLAIEKNDWRVETPT